MPAAHTRLSVRVSSRAFRTTIAAAISRKGRHRFSHSEKRRLPVAPLAGNSRSTLCALAQV
eukprot:scaffold103232_cov36-Phaeocystis_antarctica.AAC.1